MNNQKVKQSCSNCKHKDDRITSYYSNRTIIECTITKTYNSDNHSCSLWERYYEPLTGD